MGSLVHHGKFAASEVTVFAPAVFSKELARKEGTTLQLKLLSRGKKRMGACPRREIRDLNARGRDCRRRRK